MNSNAFEQLKKARDYVERVRKSLLSIEKKLLVSDRRWIAPVLHEDLRKIIESLDDVHDKLVKPHLKMAFIGTTSSGKSTLLNGLVGHCIAPMEAGEMSAGVVRITDAEKIFLDVKETPEMTWKKGQYEVHSDKDIYNHLRGDSEKGIKGIMPLYRDACKKDENIAAPRIDIGVPLAPKHGGIPSFNMPEGIEFEFYDLPGLKNVLDSRNLEVIQKHLADSFLLVVLSYKDTDDKNRDALLKEIKSIADMCKNKDAIIFVLNKIDDRKSVDNPLEQRIEELQKEIKEKLGLSSQPVFIPMSALPLYCVQTAWGAKEKPIYLESPDFSYEQLKNFFDDCAAVCQIIKKESPEKKEWFKSHDEDNIADWTSEDVPTLREWIYEYSGAHKFWKAMQKKLDAQIGAVIINPALSGVPAKIDEFAKQLQNVVHVLGFSTAEEIKEEQRKINELSITVKKSLMDSKDLFANDFREAVNTLETAESSKMGNIKYKQMIEISDIMSIISDDVYDNIMLPIRNALISGDNEQVENLEEKLSKFIPSKLAIDIRKSANHLLLSGYNLIAEKGKKFECREDEEGKHTAEIQNLKIIEERRMLLAGCVDKALLSRSKLLLQQKMSMFLEMTHNIVKEAMDEQAVSLKNMLKEYDVESITVPFTVNEREVNLPDNVFGKITIEDAEKRIPKKVREQY